MGIDTSVHTFYGVKTAWDDELAEALEENYAETRNYFKTIDCLLDGMCCNYMIFGYEIASMDVDDNDIVILDKDTDLEKIKQDMRLEWSEMLPDSPKILEDDWKIIVVRHYS